MKIGKVSGWGICTGLSIILIITLITLGVVNIPLYMVGFYYNNITAEFDSTPVQQGLHTKNPADSVFYVNTSQYYIAFNDSGQVGINCLSSDGVQIFNVDEFIFFQFDISNSTQVIELVKKYGDFNSVVKFMQSVAQYTATVVCSRYSTEDFYTKRNVISNDLGTVFGEKLVQLGIPVILGTVGMRDFQYPTDYATATQQKQQAQLQINNYLTQRQTNVSAANNVLVNTQLQANINTTIALIQANATVVAAEKQAEAIFQSYYQFGLALNNTMHLLGMENNPDQFIDYYLTNYPLINNPSNNRPLIVSL